MTLTLRLVMLVAIILYFILLLGLLKRHSLTLKYTMLWILSGIIMSLIVAFPQLLTWFAKAVGIYEPTNALFAVVSFCVIIILMSLTSIVSKLNEKNKRLTQIIALLEKRIRDIEGRE